ERFDIDLVRELATRRPDWQLVLVGPVVKIDPETLPRLPNIHYLGPKQYQELPAYLAGWDVALMPFALNESTRFISPTKTPEYLAGGRPVVSTPIRDVVNAYGESGVVRIADTPTAFIRAVEAALRMDPRVVRLRADKALDGMSSDKTCAAIREHIAWPRRGRRRPAPRRPPPPPSSAPALPAACWPSAWRRAWAGRCWWWTAVTTSAVTPTTTWTSPACWCIATVRTSSTPMPSA